MLKNTYINRQVTKKVATALGSLNEQVVYVGGAVVSLYIDDPSADDVRPTKDLDLTLEIASLGKLESLREHLIKLGFFQTVEDSVLCRFRYDDIIVDVMATEPIGWAPGNRWFKKGFSKAFPYTLENLEIKILPLPYFISTKFDAFFDRGIDDIWASHDFEDIVYLLNHVSDINQQILNSELEVKTYLIFCAKKIINDKTLKQAIIGHLFYEDQDERFEMIMAKLKKIASDA